MAEAADTPTDSAEKAYAAATAKVMPKAEPAKQVVAPKPEKRVAKKAAKPAPAKKTPAPKPKAPATTPKPTLTELKEKIMATAKTTDFSKTVTETASEMQRRAKEAYDKGTEVAGEMTEFTKGNVEALVESGKIFAAGVQDFGKSYAEDVKTAYETATADMKELAAVKSPTELLQLQGKLLRRNFDTLVAYGSKNTEAALKLANDSFAPLSGRVSLAAEKVAKAA